MATEITEYTEIEQKNCYVFCQMGSTVIEGYLRLTGRRAFSNDGLWVLCGLIEIHGPH